MKKVLEGKVALVTGATRGIGKGIALQLAEAGATVYITGRTLKSKDNKNGSLEQTVAEIRERGGVCIPCRVDHEIDAQIADLFKKIELEQNGRLDILVNNAYKAGRELFDNRNLRFWEVCPEMWDSVNNVGLRNHYYCTVYAARLMVPRKQGLIINISSMGGLFYFFSVPYGVGKAACDRMAADCGIELRKHNVACLSLWLGSVDTELATDFCTGASDEDLFIKDPFGRDIKMKTFNQMRKEGETVEFAGKVIISLATNPNIMKLSSKVIVAEDYAQSKGIRDIDNRVIPSFRQVNAGMKLLLPEPIKFLSYLIPNFVKIPVLLLELFQGKF